MTWIAHPHARSSTQCQSYAAYAFLLLLSSDSMIDCRCGRDRQLRSPMCLHQDSVRAIWCTPFYHALPEVHAERPEPSSEQNHTPAQVGSLAFVLLFWLSPPIRQSEKTCLCLPLLQEEPACNATHTVLMYSETGSMLNSCKLFLWIETMGDIVQHCQKHSLSQCFTACFARN